MTITQPHLRLAHEDVSLNRHDLQALVDVLAHEAFAITGQGLAARRAIAQLTRVLAMGVTSVRIGSD